MNDDEYSIATRVASQAHVTLGLGPRYAIGSPETHVALFLDNCVSRVASLEAWLAIAHSVRELMRACDQTAATEIAGHYFAGIEAAIAEQGAVQA